MLKHRINVAAILLMALFVLSVSAFANRSIQVELKSEKNAFRSDENIVLTVSMTNTGKRDARVLRYATPIDGITEDIFEVLEDGKEVVYIGPHYKRPAPTEKDYIIIKPGETIDMAVDISGYYDMSETGFYQISYRSEGYTIFNHKPNYMTNEDTLQSGRLQTWIEGRDTKVGQESSADVVTGT